MVLIVRDNGFREWLDGVVETLERGLPAEWVGLPDTLKRWYADGMGPGEAAWALTAIMLADGPADEPDYGECEP